MISVVALPEDQLAALLADLESDRVERKQSASDTDKLSQAVCAFANDLPAHRQPGVLFIGVTDNGQHTELPITDELLRRRSYEHTNTPVRITWYTDRVEVVNPGGPYGIVNTANFGSGVTDYRNPALADLMRSLGYVQRFGAGIPVVKSSLAANRNPPPTFEVTPTHVAVTIGARP